VAFQFFTLNEKEENFLDPDPDHLGNVIPMRTNRRNFLKFINIGLGYLNNYIFSVSPARKKAKTNGCMPIRCQLVIVSIRSGGNNCDLLGDVTENGSVVVDVTIRRTRSMAVVVPDKHAQYQHRRLRRRRRGTDGTP